MYTPVAPHHVSLYKAITFKGSAFKMASGNGGLMGVRLTLNGTEIGHKNLKKKKKYKTPG
jgi:hypothetical protein